MRARRFLTVLTSIAALAAAVAAPTASSTGIVSHLACVAPADAAGIDGVLADAGSPLAGEGATFVREGRRVGVDPRALVAIAAHETMLATYGPSQGIRNPFGLGPGWSFSLYSDAIARAATTLDNLYLPEGRIRIPDIGAKWAPLGAANDPGGLNQHWAAGVSTYYRALGGDPDLPILVDSQDASPDCGASPAEPARSAASTPPADGDVDQPDEAPQPSGPPVVTAWGGVAPTPTAEGPAGGAHPTTGEPATIAGFVFPLALPRGARAHYEDTFALPGPVECPTGVQLRCAVAVAAAADTPAVASATGVLQHAGIAEREEGIAFWLVTPHGDRVGYGPLARYAPGVAPGVTVAAGQLLGTTAGTLRIAWEADGVRINPYPLLAVTRAPID